MKRAVQKIRQIWRRSYNGPPLVLPEFPARRAAGCLLRGGFAALLTLGQPLGAWNPGGLCLLAASGGGGAGLAALGGVWLGAFTGLGFSGGLEPAAAAILIFAGNYLLDGTALAGKKRFPAALCGLMTALAGLISLTIQFSADAALCWVALTLTAALGADQFCAFLAEPAPRTGLLPGALLTLGLSAISLPGELTLGAVAAVALGYTAASRAGTCLPAVACALGLELGLGEGGALTAQLAFAALIVQALRRRPRALRLAAFFAALAAGSLLWGDAEVTLLVAALPGALLSVPLGLLPWKPSEREAGPEALLRARMEQAAAALERLEGLLTAGLHERRNKEVDQLFDNAAARVCRDCGRWGRCWRENGTETWQELSRASRTMLERGACHPSDFPDSFAESCHRLRAFSAAVDQELQMLLCRRRYRLRLQESRAVLANQYKALAAFLRRGAQSLQGRGSAEMQPRFRLELGVRARGREQVSGDRGASFSIGEAAYVLLCDGMGTGEAAAREATAAVEVLRQLLEAEFSPEDAMELLSGAYLLRDTAAFATVDLLRLDLDTGQGQLYKWGSAPSYLRRGAVVRRLGEANLPPGLEAGQASRVAAIPLSLADGAWLVMVSDGVEPEAAARAVAGFSGTQPEELAAQVIAQAALDAGSEDDRTVVALRLQECRSAKAARARKKSAAEPAAAR